MATCGVLFLCVVAGGIALAVRNASDNDSPDAGPDRRASSSDTGPTDEPSETEPTRTGPTETGTTEAGTAGPQPVSGAPIVDTLIAAASGLFPSGTEVDAAPGGESWSGTPDNVEKGFPRRLAPDDWQDATTWLIGGTEGEHTYVMHVEHLPPDTEGIQGLDSRCNGSLMELACTESRAPDGRTVIDLYYRITPGSDSIGHRVIVVGDREAGLPEVSVGETVTGTRGLELKKAKPLFHLGTDQMTQAILREDLLFALPASPPPLPSYYWCTFATADEASRAGCSPEIPR